MPVWIILFPVSKIEFEPFGSNLFIYLGAVHKLRHPIRGYGGVSQKMTKDDRGEGGGLAKGDR